MGNYFILLHNHTDLGFADLLIRNIPWIADTFDTVFMEGVRNNENISDAINRYAIHLLHGLGRTASTLDWDFYEKIMQTQDDKFRHLLLKKEQCTEEDYKNLYTVFGFKFTCFCKKLMQRKPSIRFIGAESRNYSSASWADSQRDQAMANVLIAEKNARNALFIVGSDHGMGLLSELCKSGRGGFHFLHLTVNQNDDLYRTQFITNVRNQREQNHGYAVSLGYGCTLQIKHLHAIDRIQDEVFRSFYVPYRGLVPIPPDMQVDPSTGNTVRRNLI